MIKRRKSMAVLLALAMTIGIAGVNFKTAYAGEYTSIVSLGLDSNFAEDSTGLTWLYHNNSDGTITLDGTYKIEYENGVKVGTTGSDQLKSVVNVPSELAGHKVSAVTSIVGYENRILGYGKLGKPVQKVIVPEGVKEIGRGAFDRCPNLTDIVIPASVNIIGSGAFPETWLDAHRDSDGFVIINGILVDGHKCSGDIVIPDNIRCIADGAFSSITNIDGKFPDYKNITSVKIPASVKRIGKEAFYGCNIIKAEIAEGVEVIDDDAFSHCSNLTEAKIPQSVKELSSSAFNDDPKLKNTTGNDNGLVISDGVLLKGHDAEGDVVIPESVKEIQNGAFSGNNNITSIKIPSSVKNIPADAFRDCENLKSITIENGIQSIGEHAFERAGISSINMPASVKYIGNFAFSECKNLNEVTFKNGTSVGLDSFSLTPWLNNLKDDDNFCIYNGILFDYVPSDKSEIVIPDGIKEIAGGAFSDGLQNMNITKVTIPEGVTKIGEFAFSECRNMSDLYVPSTVKTIEYGAFDFCDNISFSGPGADTAKYELDNKYPTYNAEKENSASSGNAGSEADNNETANTGNVTSETKNSEKIKPGWSYIGLSWYYGNDDGSKKTGWLYNGGNWYYFYGNGQMATGFIKLGDYAYYYLDETSTSSIGIMKSGWQKINGSWYYFNTSSDDGLEGMMNKGWKYIGGNWYYFYDDDGTMAHDTWIGNYYVNSSGAWIK